MIGHFGCGNSPSSTCRAVRHTPQAATRTRISPGPGNRSASCDHSSGPPACFSTIACIDTSAQVCTHRRVRQRTDCPGRYPYARTAEGLTISESPQARLKPRFPDHWTRAVQRRRGDKKMLETIAILLLILWLLCMVSSHTFGGFIHTLPLLAGA